MSDEKQTNAAYLDGDGRTVYTIDGRGVRVNVGEITGRTPDGYEVTAFAPLKSIAGTVRQVPRVESVADAETLFGRGAAVIGARGGVAECLAMEAPSVVSAPASRSVADNRPPPVALNELYVSRVTGEEYCVVSVLIGHAHLRDRSGCVRHWSFERIARDLMQCDPSRPKGSAAAVLAAENAALREALAASGELLAEAHAEVDRLRGTR